MACCPNWQARRHGIKVVKLMYRLWSLELERELDPVLQA
jgi:hypothetical protein